MLPDRRMSDNRDGALRAYVADLAERIAVHGFPAQGSPQYAAAVDKECAAIAKRFDPTDLQATFDLMRAADMRAIAAWQEAHPGNDLVWPDQAHMVTWLMEYVESLRKLLAEAFAPPVGNIEHFVESWDDWRFRVGQALRILQRSPEGYVEPVKGEPSFDRGGYPTDETLERIRLWPIESNADFEAVMDYAGSCWKYPDWWSKGEPEPDPLFADLASGQTRPTISYVFSTGGWSGNESLVSAIEANWIVQAVGASTWHKGGHFEYRFPTDRPIP